MFTPCGTKPKSRNIKLKGLLQKSCNSSKSFDVNSCAPGYSLDNIFIIEACTAAQGSFPDPTLAAQCQGAAVLLNNHCFAQVLNSMIGGAILDIDTTALLVASIGTNPVITGLVAVTLAGVAGQAAWFIHRRKKKVQNS